MICFNLTMFEHKNIDLKVPFLGNSGISEINIDQLPAFKILVVRAPRTTRKVAGQPKILINVVVRWTTINFHAPAVNITYQAYLVPSTDNQKLGRTTWNLYNVIVRVTTINFSLIRTLLITIRHSISHGWKNFYNSTSQFSAHFPCPSSNLHVICSSTGPMNSPGLETTGATAQICSR